MLLVCKWYLRKTNGVISKVINVRVNYNYSKIPVEEDIRDK